MRIVGDVEYTSSSDSATVIARIIWPMRQLPGHSCRPTIALSDLGFSTDTNPLGLAVAHGGKAVLLLIEFR